MAKRASTLSLMLPPRPAGTPAYLWLCEALRSEILEGRLRPGTRLPATRDLSASYGLARGTIVNAFEELKAEGYLRGSVGSGTYVNQVLPEELLHAGRRRRAAAPVEPPARRHLSDFGRRVETMFGYPPGPARAFRTNQPALDLFPTALWAQLASRRLRRASAALLLGCDPLGLPALRTAIADYLRTSRGVKCGTEQVAIVSGVQEALDLAARLFLDPGDRVCMENPGYVGASLAFAARGARIEPVPLDGEGMEVPSPELRNVRLAYLTPAHQYPTGISMSLPRRFALLEWARKSGALLFEDDYDSEFRYSGRPIPALQGLDRHGVVLFAGSFSKVLFPALRLGYLVVPQDLVERFTATLSITNRHAPGLEQAVVADFMEGGHFERHVRKMREVYAERSATLLAGARERLAGLLEVSPFEAGLQTAGFLLQGLDGEAAAEAARQRGVEVTALSRYWIGDESGGRREGLQLGFAATDAEEIRRGIERLAAALEAGLRLQRL